MQLVDEVIIKSMNKVQKLDYEVEVDDIVSTIFKKMNNNIIIKNENNLEDGNQLTYINDTIKKLADDSIEKYNSVKDLKKMLCNK